MMTATSSSLPTSTTWSCSVDSSGASPVAQLNVSVDGNPATPFRITAVCYSPCPIGASNSAAPAIGDWFWDSYDGVTNWEGTWSNDLPNIAALGANLIRVYCFLDQQLVSPPPTTPTIFTHTDFLDACLQNGLYVLVGIPLPQWMFCLGEDSPVPDFDRAWWTDRLRNTVAQVAAHPAVFGFTIANEVDNGSVDTYSSDSAKAKYWWGVVEEMAAIAKEIAPGKLIGIANHDDTGICANCAGEMAACTAIDFWGVNTYQPTSFASVFGGDSYTTGYALLSGAALKPVVLTEYGFPSTSRLTADTLNPQNIYSDATTQQNVASVLNTMLPLAYAQLLNMGVCYFEYCDEWWNQSGYSITAGFTCPDATGADAPDGGAGADLAPPDIYTWYGGPPACGFPNYYWDNDGFGVYSVGVGEGRDPAEPWDAITNAPALPLDTRTSRSAVIAAIQKMYLG
jgi:Glucanosyltransferase